ncbi:MAG: hypothetical protein PVS3B3_20650 [Ktedonobacteraceae bacterium]
MTKYTEDVEQRLEYLVQRLHTNYEAIGQSSGRPFIYFVYHPSLERNVQRIVGEQLRSDTQITVHPLDILPLTITALQGQEELRQRLLNDPLRTESATDAILRLWTRRISSEITAKLVATTEDEHPVIVLYNLAALHPLGNPTSLMEFLAEQEPRNPRTRAIVPVVLLVPGTRPPQTSRLYNFLDQERLQLGFYRGEEL